jgi:hypothetical protein
VILIKGDFMRKQKRSDMVRLTIDIPTATHLWLKKRAKALGKSMREIVIEAVEKCLCESDPHIPNKRLRKVLSNIEDGKNLTHYESLEDLYKKLGI